MARKNIPLKDKTIVKRRLAQGMSYSEAMKGTAVSSKGTVASVAKRESNDIERLRQKYLKLIESFDAGEVNRAELWAEMTRATKLFGKEAVAHPDWKSRAVALRYIDNLAGITSEQELAKVNIAAIIQRDREVYGIKAESKSTRV